MAGPWAIPVIAILAFAGFSALFVKTFLINPSKDDKENKDDMEADDNGNITDNIN